MNCHALYEKEGVVALYGCGIVVVLLSDGMDGLHSVVVCWWRARDVRGMFSKAGAKDYLFLRRWQL